MLPPMRKSVFLRAKLYKIKLSVSDGQLTYFYGRQRFGWETHNQASPLPAARNAEWKAGLLPFIVQDSKTKIKLVFKTVTGLLNLWKTLWPLIQSFVLDDIE